MCRKQHKISWLKFIFVSHMFTAQAITCSVYVCMRKLPKLCPRSEEMMRKMISYTFSVSVAYIGVKKKLLDCFQIMLVKHFVIRGLKRLI